MADCDQIGPLVGPFEDGELEPHEMQEVAFHVVGCDKCTAILEEYRGLALALRNTVLIPPLDGFAAAVNARIERSEQLEWSHTPLRARLGRYFGSVSDRLRVGVMIGAAAAVSAIVTVVLVTPIAHRVVEGDHAAPSTLSRGEPPSSVAMVKLPGAVNSTANAKTSVADVVAGSERPDARNSQAVISSLEADSPSVAVWNEPRSDTTVIWVPDQP